MKPNSFSKYSVKDLAKMFKTRRTIVGDDEPTRYPMDECVLDFDASSLPKSLDLRTVLDLKVKD